MSKHIPVVSTVFIVGEGAVVTGTTVVTTGVVETGVKVVTSIAGVVVMPGFVVASDTVATVALVVTAVGSGINPKSTIQVCNGATTEVLTYPVRTIICKKINSRET